VPRRGALYKHFASKEELLRVVMAQHSEAVEAMDAEVTTTIAGPLEQLETFARWGIDELRREHELTRSVMKEGDRFPELAAAFREAIVEPGHRLATAWLEAQDAGIADPQALASVLVDALVGFTLQETLFGPPPAGVDEERFLAAWVQMARPPSRQAKRAPPMRDARFPTPRCSDCR